MLSLLLYSFFSSFVAFGQQDPGLKSRVNLEDISIQGEANKNRSFMQSRNRFELDSRIKPRVNFRKELQEESERESKSSFFSRPKEFSERN
jgi:hypothetical protein